MCRRINLQCNNWQDSPSMGRHIFLNMIGFFLQRTSLYYHPCLAILFKRILVAITTWLPFPVVSNSIMGQSRVQKYIKRAEAVLSSAHETSMYNLSIQGEHKVFPWLQTFITRKLRGHVGALRCTSVRRVSAVDNFPTRWCTSTLGFTCSSVCGCNISKQVDWERWSDTLATTIAGYHPLDFFLWGLLRTKCFRHHFQLLQIWRQKQQALLLQ